MSDQENARSEHADSVQQLPIPPGQSNVFTTLMFWFSFQPWALAWEVLLQVCLQTFLLTLFQRLRFGKAYVSTECGESSFPVQVGFPLLLLLHDRFSGQ